MQERVKDLLEEYDEIFNEDTGNSRVELPKKKSRTAGTVRESTALEDSDIRELVMNGQV